MRRRTPFTFSRSSTKARTNQVVDGNLSCKALTIAVVALCTKLGADCSVGDYIPKPKGMRWRTYDRLLEQIASAEQIIDSHLAAFLYKLDPSLGR
jgi:hypothetical protein